MGWCGPRVRRPVQLALGLLLGFSTLMAASERVAARPAADDLARDWLDRSVAAMAGPGKVFRAQQSARVKSEAGEATDEFTIWIDAEGRKARQEVRRDNNLVSVLVVDNWELASFDAALNKVSRVSVAEDVRARVKNPAYSVLAPSLIAAYQAGEVNPVQEVTVNPSDSLAGRDAAKLTFTRRETLERQVPVTDQQGRPAGASGSGGQQAPQMRSEQVTLQQEYTLYVDARTSLPLQETARGSEVDSGRELSLRTVTYNQAELVDRGPQVTDLLSLSAIEAMQQSVDQQVGRARSLGIPLYWLGMELPLPRGFTDAKGQRQQSLVLNDVLVQDQQGQPRQAIFTYGTRDDPTVPYVILIQQPRSDWDSFIQQAGGRFWTQLDGVQRSQVQVPGASGTLYQLQPPQPSAQPSQPQGGGRPGQTASTPARPVQLPPLLMVQIQGNDAVTNVLTVPLPNNDGQQANPFHAPEGITQLAGALARVP